MNDLVPECSGAIFPPKPHSPSNRETVRGQDKADYNCESQGSLELGQAGSLASLTNGDCGNPLCAPAETICSRVTDSQGAGDRGRDYQYSTSTSQFRYEDTGSCGRSSNNSHWRERESRKAGMLVLDWNNVFTRSCSSQAGGSKTETRYSREAWYVPGPTTPVLKSPRNRFM